MSDNQPDQVWVTRVWTDEMIRALLKANIFIVCDMTTYERIQRIKASLEK